MARVVACHAPGRRPLALQLGARERVPGARTRVAK
eukprot:CAMPEP_0197924074 /NCGR_PEP_ID=MMETSP1439-20131203/95064_1 /TAXON_ID=66791 /ORGANISM="Gonyaulax spinifera, Strain CCMP409" /LENGTH=34 /DNA_ID= /DNA_START= /DNA_END= /DNA_ORIENTATION=